LNIENIQDPDDWEWYYGTMSRSELLDIVKEKGGRQKETQKPDSPKQESPKQEARKAQRQWN
jgi:hypothetical protein